MRSVYDARAPKRPVNLSLNEDLVLQARGLAGNLSGLVESLLADFVARENGQRAEQAAALKQAVRTWNAFGGECGSFADEHSTL